MNILQSKNPPEISSWLLWRDEAGVWRRCIDGRWTEDEEANAIARLERRLEQNSIDSALLSLLFRHGDKAAGKP